MKKKILFGVATLIFACALFCGGTFTAEAEMPFYGLNPKPLVERSVFCTFYGNSSFERKHNISLAVKSINGVFVDIGGEFSFNRTVGRRTKERGYKEAKIIVGDGFVEGTGGGVCQVSTTLYNAVLNAGLKITEYHAHSLAVSYVSPSFDAMVNYGSADLRFINDTDNPVIVYAFCDGETITVKIVGEKADFTIKRQSEITERVKAPEPFIEYDTEGKYPDLKEGEKAVVSYGKDGIKSKAVFVKTYKNGKKEYFIRKDFYKPVRGRIIVGTAKAAEETPEEVSAPDGN